MKQNVWLPGNSYNSIAEVSTSCLTLLTAFRKNIRTWEPENVLCCWTTHACHLKWSRKTLVWPVTPQLPLWVHPSKFITPGEQLEPSFTLYIHTLSLGFAVVIPVVVRSTTHEQQQIKRKSLDSLDFFDLPGDTRDLVFTETTDLWSLGNSTTWQAHCCEWRNCVIWFTGTDILKIRFKLHSVIFSACWSLKYAQNNLSRGLATILWRGR